MSQIAREPARTGLALLRVCASFVGVTLLASTALAHGVTGRDAQWVSEAADPRFFAFLYLGAKHMVTGYDHLLFLAGVVFFLRSLRQVALYVTLFALGHSLTLLGFVLLSWRVDPIAIDAVVALSVVYKALENLGAFVPPFRIDPRAAVLAFGLVHGMGLASKLQTLHLSHDGLLGNLLAFNLGVELGQLCALSVLVLALAAWRRSDGFARYAVGANQVLLTLGFVLFEYQVASFILMERT